MPQPDLLRSFIALYPDPVARGTMGQFVDCLRQRERAVRWEQTDKIHVTMKFIGDIESAKLDAIAQELRKRITEAALSLDTENDGSILSPGRYSGVIDRVGGFPNLRRPRIVWLGFSEMPAAVVKLQRLVEEVCREAGIDGDDKKFTLHFKIGRVRPDADTAGLENVLQACSFPSSPVRFTRLCIMESTLTPKGAIHTERTHISLTPGE